MLSKKSKPFFGLVLSLLFFSFSLCAVALFCIAMRKIEFDLSVPAVTVHDSSQGKLKLIEDYCICLICREADVD